MQKSVPYKQSTIHYYTFGSGNEALFYFHGYGRNGNDFAFLEQELGNRFTVICINFPFHYNTIWNEGLLLSEDDLLNIISLTNPFDDDTFSLLGYSMGGRVALHLLQIIPQKIKHVVLIAPDGLHNNILQKIATHTIVGNMLFKFTMQYPTWLFLVIKAANSMGLFNKSIFKFVHFYIDNNEEREALYKRWTTMRKFKPKIALLQKTVHQYQIPIGILFGKYDRVIVAKHGFSFKKNEPLITIKELETGHQLLKPKYAGEIAAMFNR